MDVLHEALFISCITGAATVIAVLAHHASHHRSSTVNTTYHRNVCIELAWSSAPMLIIVAIAIFVIASVLND